MRARRRLRQGTSARAFGLRLLLAVAAAFAVIGALANVVVTDQLERRQLDTYVRTQLADVESFEATGRKAGNEKVAVREVAEVIDAIGRRPGTVETLLIDRDLVIRASGSDPDLVGTKDGGGPRTDAVLLRAERYAGQEADPDEDSRDFELMAPVELPGGRYVFEVAYDPHVLEGQLTDVRRTLGLLGLMALIVGGGVF